jgi:hypothetical protein
MMEKQNVVTPKRTPASEIQGRDLVKEAAATFRVDYPTVKKPKEKRR